MNMAEMIKRRIGKKIINESKILNKIDQIGTSKKKFIEMERYMEALVAYHRFYGGKDE